MGTKHSNKITDLSVKRESDTSTIEVVIKVNQYEKLVFYLNQICFIQRKDRHVHLYEKSGKSNNTFIRTLKQVRKTIEDQLLSHYFYFNSKVIINYYYFDLLVDQSLSDKEAMKILKSQGINMGLSELRNMRKQFKKV